MNFKRAIFLILILAGSVAAVRGGMDIYDDISLLIRTGNAKELAGYFNTNVDLTIINQEDVYSKAQAEQILKDFFSKNVPKTFTILHKGSSKEGTIYAIGNLVTATGAAFRTSFFVKQISGKFYIQEMRFEKE
jgi:hypothetical protein